MKPSALRIERMLEKIEAKLVPPERKCLCAIIHEGDDEAEAKEKALAEHVARHPKMSAARLRTSTGYCRWSSNGQEKPAIHPFLTADNRHGWPWVPTASFH